MPISSQGSSSMLRRLVILAVLTAVIAVFFHQGWHRLLTFDALKAKQVAMQVFTEANRPLVIVVFALTYIAVVTAQLPGAAIMTVAGGVLFGLGLGVVLVSFVSTVGATTAMLVSRYLLRDWIESRYGSRLASLNRGIDRDGAFYLFTLRLIPVVPFGLINLGIGLTKMKTFTFFWVSQLGMLAGTFVYVFAGTQLARVDSLASIASPRLIGAFALLGIFPLIARRILTGIKARRAFRGYSRPKSFDYNVVVIGAGSGGLVASYIAAAVKAKVALIEKGNMGGDCLNTGCVPSKALIRSAKMLHSSKRATDWGFKERPDVEFDFGEVMDRVQEIIAKIEPHDSVERYRSLGVECLSGVARIDDPWRVRVGDRVVTTRTLVVATGAEPLVPPIPGLDLVDALTSDNLWQLRELPERLVVLGGGPIGCEMTQAFARLGSQVTQVEMLPRIMTREDPDISQLVVERFESEGIRVLTGHKAVSFGIEESTTEGEAGSGQRYLVCENVENGEEIRIDFDRVLVALGRRGRGAGCGLEELGVEIMRSGTVAHDEFMRTSVPNIFVCGDVAGPYQFTHVAAHQAWYAAVNALFSPVAQFKADYRIIPWATFTDPEVARVGLNELDAKDQGIPYEVTTYDIDDLDRAITDGVNYGVVKVLTAPGNDRILGVTIVGPHAGDLLAEYVLAMKHGLGLKKILGTIHTYPTLAEANKFVAGNWRKDHAPLRLLAFAERFHGWRRGEPLGTLAKALLVALVVGALAVAGALAMLSQSTDEIPPGPLGNTAASTSGAGSTLGLHVDSDGPLAS